MPKKGDIIVNKNGDEWEVTKVGHDYYELMHEDGSIITYTKSEIERDFASGWWHYKGNPKTVWWSNLKRSDCRKCTFRALCGDIFPEVGKCPGNSGGECWAIFREGEPVGTC